MNKSTAERLKEKYTVSPDGCWVWHGPKSSHGGYGQIKVGTKQMRAHRVAYELAKGSIPPGMLVCHHCDNPPCVNPAHLFLGTHADNNRDCRQKGRAKAPAPGSNRAFSAETVAAIRALSAGGRTRREIASAFGVHFNTIKGVLIGRTYRA